MSELKEVTVSSHMGKHRKLLTITPTCLCNLNCKYCYVNHCNLQEAERKFADALTTDYYLDFSKSVIKEPDTVKRFELWGGEPTLKLEQAYPIMKKLLNYYPIDEVFFSTNFCLDNVVDKIQDFILFLNQFKRKIRLCWQISIDGNEEIMKNTRGEGVYDTILQHFENLVNKVYMPENISMRIGIKPTIDIETFLHYFSNESFYYSYFKSFQSLIDLYHGSQLQTKYDTTMNDEFVFASIAQPCNFTIEDGKQMKEIVCKMLDYEINKPDNITFNYFVPNLFRAVRRRGFYLNKIQTSWPGNSVCGLLRYVFNLFPDYYVGGCHRNVDDFVKATNKEKYNDKTLIRLEELELFSRHIMFSYDRKAKCEIASAANTINVLSRIGTISSIYKDKFNALRAAKFITNIIGGCHFVNYDETESASMAPIGLFKLWLNGAEERIYEYILERYGTI